MSDKQRRDFIAASRILEREIRGEVKDIVELPDLSTKVYLTKDGRRQLVYKFVMSLKELMAYLADVRTKLHPEL